MARKSLKEIAAEIAAEGKAIKVATNGHAKASRKDLDAKVAKAIDETHKVVAVAKAKQQPALPTKKDEAQVRTCLCGCGGSPASKKGFYLPGHDARHSAQVMAIVRANGITLAQISTLAN